MTASTTDEKLNAILASVTAAAAWQLLKDKYNRASANFEAACDRIEEQDKTISQLRLRVVQLEEENTRLAEQLSFALQADDWLEDVK